MSNEYDLGAAGTAAVPAAAVAAADPFDMFPGVDADDYEEITGRQPVYPGDYLFEVTSLGWDQNKKGTLLLGLKVVKPLQVDPGVPSNGTGTTVITERFNSFWPPEPGAAEGVQKAHKISVGRFKGAYHLTTGVSAQGRIDGPFLKEAKTKMVGKQLVGRVKWTTRVPKGSKEKGKAISYTEWLTNGKPEIFDNISGFRAAKEGEV